MARKRTIFANVCIKEGRRVYTSFGDDLEKMVREAETINAGVIAIEKAHAGEPPVWERPETTSR